MKLLKVNLLNKNLIINELFPSIAMDKCINTMCLVCCKIMSCLCCCCCCMVNKMSMLCSCLCKMMNKNNEYVKYRTTGLFMKYFVNTAVVFCA
ncbi:hypothetical protein [Clostridium arbusti]|uniref:hypothetical protein n=1 Tax=Clostridium arbusti TaxID=1137848 RepID=UPI000289B7A8|nr:hypothetical protein [Clostridium arbusti]